MPDALSLLRSAISYHSAGDLLTAEHLYRQVLDVCPEHSDALRLLGMSARQRSDFASAENWLNKCISVHSDSSDAFHELGLLMFQMGRLEQAIEAYDTALRLAPLSSDTHYNIGNVYYAKGELANARSHYTKSLQLNPSLALGHFNLGIIAQEDQNHETAIEHYRRAISLNPNWPEAHLNIAVSQRQLKDLTAAQQSLHQALKLDPNYFEALVNLGSLLQDSREFQSSEECFRRAMALRPGEIVVHLNLASVLEASSRLDEAEACLLSALARDPKNPQVNAFLGALLIKQNRLPEAARFSHLALDRDPDYLPARVNLMQLLLIQNRLDESTSQCEQVLKQDPYHSDALVTLGVIHTRLRRPNEAKDCLRTALVRNPKNPDALVNLGICELLVGEFESGWRHYEGRWQSNFTCCKRRHFKQPEWNGECIDGKTLLLTAEQGFGDTLQFVRYAPLAAQRGARIVIECQLALKKVIESAPEVSHVVAYGEPLPNFDLHVPLLSLPRIFNTSLTSIPAQVPYLRPPFRLNHHDLFAKKDRSRVGLVWCGSRSQNDDQRPVPLAALAPILENPDFDFFSLQLGDAASQLNRSKYAAHIRDLSPLLTDFSVTAAVLTELDLVITIDTAVAHLAGALGRPTWILLPYAPDWRWMLEGDTTPWYPTARLFRQTEFGNWNNPVQKISEGLQRSPLEDLEDLTSTDKVTHVHPIR